jgi:hypothetical protein
MERQFADLILWMLCLYFCNFAEITKLRLFEEGSSRMSLGFDDDDDAVLRRILSSFLSKLSRVFAS